MKYTSLFIILVSLYNCKPHTNKNNDQINGSVITPQNNTLVLNSIFDSCKLIQLTGISLTGINKVEWMDSLLVIKGKANESELHLFTNEGKYLYSIIKTGRGANETINMQDFVIDPVKKHIDILCDYGRKIITYSLPEKKIINTTEICPEIYAAENIKKLDSTRYILYKTNGFTKNTEFKINIYNKAKNKLEKGFLPINKKTSEYVSFSQFNNLYENNQQIFFYETFRDTIYQCSSEEIEPVWIFQKQEFSFPQQLLHKGYQGLREFIETCKNSRYIWGHINVFEYRNLYLSLFNYKDKLYLNVIDKTGKKANSYTRIHDNLVTDELLELTTFFQIGNNQEYCFFQIEPIDLLEIIENKKQQNKYADYQKRFPRSCQFIEQLKFDSNTVLVLLKSKT